jgi:hypothetical protein
LSVALLCRQEDEQTGGDFYFSYGQDKASLLTINFLVIGRKIYVKSWAEKIHFGFFLGLPLADMIPDPYENVLYTLA